MKYIGGKARIAKQIATYTNNIGVCEGITNYYEPFCGGCSVAEEVAINNITCNDLNNYLIALYKKVKEGMWDFKFITREERDAIREKYVAYRDGESDTLGYEEWFIGWVGFSTGFRSVFFQGYAGIDETNGTNYQYNMYKALEKEREKLVHMEFTNMSFDKLDIKKGSIVYCDAPYMSTRKYNVVDKFNFKKYYKWLKRIAQDNLVLISEYTMPAGFKEVDSWVLTCESSHTSKELRQEKLFVVEGGYLVDKYFDNVDMGGIL